jgi:hypothetical protein
MHKGKIEGAVLGGDAVLDHLVIGDGIGGNVNVKAFLNGGYRLIDCFVYDTAIHFFYEKELHQALVLADNGESVVAKGRQVEHTPDRPY